MFQVSPPEPRLSEENQQWLTFLGDQWISSQAYAFLHVGEKDVGWGLYQGEVIYEAPYVRTIILVYVRNLFDPDHLVPNP